MGQKEFFMSFLMHCYVFLLICSLDIDVDVYISNLDLYHILSILVFNNNFKELEKIISTFIKYLQENKEFDISIFPLVGIKLLKHEDITTRK